MDLFRNPDFSLRQLQYAVAIAETGGFSSAASRCGVSQPSLSAQVAKLEEALGTTLFERHARQVHLTQAGRALMPRMRALLEEQAAMAAHAQQLVDPYSVVLRVGIIPTLAPYLLPKIVVAMRARDRAPRVHWLELQTAVCEEALASGDIDAMLIADPPSLPSATSVEVGWEPFRVVVPETHVLTGPVGLDALSSEEVLLLEDGHCLRDHALSLCLLPGAQESPYRATSLPTLVQMVAAGAGVSVLPAFAEEVELGRAQVRTLPFDDPAVGRHLWLGWRSRSPHVGLFEELGEIVTTTARGSAGG
jgi:LysR family hydrogen peroxide-inducible transcriptional activator